MTNETPKAMVDIAEAINVADAIRHARNQPEVWRALKGYVERFGFTNLGVLTGLDATSEEVKPHILYSDAPASFIEAFDKRRMLQHHPLVQQAINSNEPFTTRQIQASDLTPEQRATLEFIGNELSLTTAMIVPVRRNGKLLGIVSFAGMRCRLGPIERSILHLLAHTALMQALTISETPQPAAPVSDLSPRELQCLQWASRGKTDAEIGVILGISARTARFHIENSKRKLGAATRVQAVAEAMRRHAIAA